MPLSGRRCSRLASRAVLLCILVLAFQLFVVNQAAASAKAWTFDCNWTGWTLVNGTPSQLQSCGTCGSDPYTPCNPGSIRAHSSNTDMQLIGPNPSTAYPYAFVFNGSNSSTHRNYLRMGYRNWSSDGGGRIYADYGSGFTSGNSIALTTGANSTGSWRYKTVSMSAIPNWPAGGSVKRIRIDPFDITGADFDVDFIVLRVDDLPPTMTGLTATPATSSGNWTPQSSFTIQVSASDPPPQYEGDVQLNTNPDLYASGVDYFQRQLDGVGLVDWDTDADWIYGTASETFPITIPKGQHRFSVRPVDVVGFAPGTWSYVDMFSDPDPPAAPPGLYASPGGWTGANGFSFCWGAVTTDFNGTSNPSGVSRYEYQVDGGGVIGVGGLCAYSIGAPSGGAHTFSVRAVDGAGNVGDWSSVPFYYDPASPGPPTITSVTPSGWTNVNAFTVTWSDPGDAYSGINRYQWRVDGVGANDIWSNAASGAFAPGPGGHGFTVRAIDNVGNVGGWSAPGWLYFDNVPPTVPTDIQIVPSACGETNDFAFSWRAASDLHSGVAGYQCRINGGGIVDVGSPSYHGPAPLEGQNLFEVRATDVAGNVSGWAGTEFVHRTVYVVTSSAGPHGTISPSGPTTVHCGDELTFTITPDPGFKVSTLTVDGDSVSPVPSYSFTNIMADHTIHCEFADSTAPYAHVLQPNGGESLVAGTVATLRWSATDAAGVTAVDLSLSRSGPAGPFASLASGISNSGAHDWIITGPASSDCYLKVVAHDAIGNAGEDRSDMAFAIAVVRDSMVWCPTQQVTYGTSRSEAPDLAVTASGMQLVWQEGPASGTSWDVRYTRGARQWPDDTLAWQPAIALSGQPSNCSPSIAADSHGRLHVAWAHEEEPASEQILYRRWDGVWGAPECLRTGQNTARDPAIVVDGADDVHVLWSEYVLGQGTIYHKRWHSAWEPEEGVSLGAGRAEPDVAADPQNWLHAVWLGSEGGVSGVYYKAWANAWGAETQVNTSTVDAASPAVAADAAGGVHVVWSDTRSGHPEVYYRSSDGTAWGPEFAVSALDESSSLTPDVGVDGAGRVHVVWSDTRDGNPGIYHRIWDGAWLPAERVTDSLGSSSAPRIVCTGDYLYLVWTDDRGGGPEVYWRKGTVCPNGICIEQPTPVLATLADSRVQDGRVFLRWYVTGSGSSSAAVYRQAPGAAWTRLGERSPDGAGYLAFEDGEVAAGRRYGYRLGLHTAQGEVFAGETWVDVPALGFALQGARPNPAEGGLLSVQFTLPSAAPASLALYDVSGRQVQRLDVSALGPGSHVVELRPQATLAAGVYLLRLTQGSRAATERVAIVR